MGSALLSWITKRYDEYVAISLSVLIFAVESVVILLFIHESKDCDSPPSPTTTTLEKERNNKSLQTFKPIIRFHANLGPIPFHLNRSKRDLTSNETVISFAFILYIIYLLCIDSLNKGFGAVKVVYSLVLLCRLSFFRTSLMSLLTRLGLYMCFPTYSCSSRNSSLHPFSLEMYVPFRSFFSHFSC